MYELYFIQKSNGVRSAGIFSSFVSPLHHFLIVAIMPMAIALTIVRPPLPLHKHFNFLYKLVADVLYAEEQATIGKVREPTVNKIVTTPLTPLSPFARSHPDLLEENVFMFTLHNLPFSQMQFVANPLFHSKYEGIVFPSSGWNNPWSLNLMQTEEIPGK